MRASAEPDPTAVAGRRRRVPRPVIWLLWLLGALLGSVVVGFLAGLARPREPDPWAPPAATPEPPKPSPAQSPPAQSPQDQSPPAQPPPAQSPPDAPALVNGSADSGPPLAGDD